MAKRRMEHYERLASVVQIRCPAPKEQLLKPANVDEPASPANPVDIKNAETAPFAQGAETAALRQDTNPAHVSQETEDQRSKDFGCPGGDCLPSDSIVWLEGAAKSVPLTEVAIGNRILCLDSLTNQLKYVEVAGSTVSTGSENQWLVVQLEDGTQLEMTANHPVIPRNIAMRSVKQHSGLPIRAADLKPKVHAVPVLKVMHVPVAAVSWSDRSPEACSLKIKQPERNLIFSTRRGSEGISAGAIAVGSSDLTPCSPPGLAAMSSVCVKNTFLSINDDSNSFSNSSMSGMFAERNADHSHGSMTSLSKRSTERANAKAARRPKRKLPRCNSAPPTQGRAEACEEALAEAHDEMMAGMNANSTLTMSREARAHDLSMFNRAHHSLERLGGREDFSQDSFTARSARSAHSSGSSDYGARQLQVGPPLQLIPGAMEQAAQGLDVQCVVQSDGRSASLSDLLELQHSSITSFGGFAHARGECRPCRFHYLGSQRCWKEKLCERCHEMHHAEKVSRRVRRGGAKKNPAVIQAMLDLPGDSSHPYINTPLMDEAWRTYSSLEEVGGKRLFMTAL